MKRERLNWHLSIPACQIMAGARRHLSLISCNELKKICGFYNCSVAEIEDRFWSAVKRYRGKA